MSAALALSADRPSMDKDMERCTHYDTCLHLAAAMDTDRVCSCGGVFYVQEDVEAWERILRVGGGVIPSPMYSLEEQGDSFDDGAAALYAGNPIYEMVGEKIGQLTLIGLCGTVQHKRIGGRPTTEARWQLQCSCGNKVEVSNITVKRWIAGVVKVPMCQACRVATRVATNAEGGPGSEAETKDGGDAIDQASSVG